MLLRTTVIHEQHFFAMGHHHVLHRETSRMIDVQIPTSNCSVAGDMPHIQDPPNSQLLQPKEHSLLLGHNGHESLVLVHRLDHSSKNHN